MPRNFKISNELLVVTDYYRIRNQQPLATKQKVLDYIARKYDVTTQTIKNILKRHEEVSEVGN